MPSSYFDFKQFRVRHDRSGLKVTTEGCLFGAISGEHFRSPPSAFSALDIGTGTGLLALMLAQETSASFIDAVEMEEAAAGQAAENAGASPWAQKIQVHHTPIDAFASRPQPRSYDLIISNPPFYDQYLQSDVNPNRNRAMHTVSLKYEQLASVAQKLLSPTGSFFVLYPAVQMDLFKPVAAVRGLFPIKFWHIRQKEGAPVWRVAAEFRKEKAALLTEDVIIHNKQGGYHPQYIRYLKPFYLKM